MSKIRLFVPSRFFNFMQQQFPGLSIYFSVTCYHRVFMFTFLADHYSSIHKAIVIKQE